MTPRTLVFTATYPFNEDYALKFGFDILQKRGFKLIVLNLVDVLLPGGAAKAYGGSLGPVHGVEQVRVGSLRQFEDIMRGIEGWKLVVLSSFSTIPLLRAIRSAGLGYLQLYANEEPPQRVPVGDRLARLARKAALSPRRFLAETVMPRLPGTWLGVEPPRFVVRGSEEVPKEFPSGTILIDAHSFDYDRSLRNKAIPRHPEAPSGDYFVHLECPPWECHDYLVYGLKAAVTKEEYGTLINGFFDFVEDRTGVPVVVSAHPKHTQDENVYGGRPFLYGTEPLVRHAKGVFCHYTGALKFAVIHRKPLCFISSRRLADDAYYQMNLKSYAGGLRAPVRMIDEESEREALLAGGFFSLDEAAYDDYFRRYVAARPQEKRLLWDIVADALEACPA